MSEQQAETWIFVARITGDDVFETDQSDPPLTHEQAGVVAERFMDLFVERVKAEYPDADIEIGQGNGLDGFKVQDDNGHEDEIISHLDSIASALWENDQVWEGVR